VKNYKDDARKTFDKMAVKYETHYYGSQSRIMYKKVALKIEKFKNEFILDLGCGKGLFLEIIKGYKSKLYGADISPEMIKCAQERVGNYAELKVADSENLPWVENTFDLIVCILSFHHFPNPEKSLNEMKRVLINNGHVTFAELWIPAPLRYLTNLYMRSKFNRTGDVKVYSKNEWLNMLTNTGFININIEKTNSIYLIISAEITK
jgi:ubiquinone/menaquinone biosynthesis C-methylase UbiE